MKTTKLILAIVFLTFSTMAFSQSLMPDQNQPEPTLSTKISFKVAIRNQPLVNAMKAQLEPSFLEGPYYQRVYTVKVKLSKVVFLIQGTRTEWKDFFNGHFPINHLKADG